MERWIGLCALFGISGCGSVDDHGDPATCYARSECEAGEYCTFAYEAEADGDSPGHCLPLLSADEPCEDGQCAEGLVCGREAGHCLEIADEGEACTADDVCADGLVCNDASDPPECHPPAGEGEACANLDDCAEGLTCNAGVSPSECRAPAIEGGACGDVADCASGLSCTGGACAGSGTTPTTTSGEGCDKSTVAGGKPAGRAAPLFVVALAFALGRRSRRTVWPSPIPQRSA
jgi:MYXO-CTERM domain-containing protein